MRPATTRAATCPALAGVYGRGLIGRKDPVATGDEALQERGGLYRVRRASRAARASASGVGVGDSELASEAREAVIG